MRELTIWQWLARRGLQAVVLGGCLLAVGLTSPAWCFVGGVLIGILDPVRVKRGGSTQ